MKSLRARSSASEARAHLLERAREVADLVLLAVDDRLRERAARDVVGGGPQPREPARERLGGERTGEQRDAEGERRRRSRAAARPPTDLLLDVAQRRLDEQRRRP